MITVKLKGGLGNQLFQYAFGRAVSLKLETPLMLNVSHFENQRDTDPRRNFQLNCFNLHATISTGNSRSRFDFIKAKIDEISSLTKSILNPYGGYIFNPKELEVKDNSALDGSWQSEKYFRDIETTLRHDLTLKEKLGPKAKLFKDRIKQVEENGGVSTSIHIRRGDYVTNKYSSAYHGALDMTYYYKAISVLQSKLCGKQLVLFVFSDDVGWVKENLKTEVPFICVSRPEIKDEEDMFLMSQCNHNIISNSSFGWWGAWLNSRKNKIVIAPKKWVRDPRANTNDVTPLDWVKI